MQDFWMLLRLDNTSWRKTLQIFHNFMQWHVVNTFFQERKGSSQPKGWIQGNTKIGPVLEVATCYLHGKHGVEVRIMSLNRDNSHSWVRFSHGSNKFVMNLSNNEQEIPEVQLEEYAFKMDAKDFLHADQKRKQNHKEENLPALPQEQFLLREEFGPMLNQGNIYSPIMKYRRNWCIFLVMDNMCIEKMMELFNSGEWKKFFRNISHIVLICLIIDGKHA